MLDNDISKKYVFYIFFFSTIVGFVGLWFSPFLVSLSTALIALSILPSIPKVWKEYTMLFALFLGMLALGLIDYLRTENTYFVSAKLLLLVGFLFIQLAALFHFKNKAKEMLWLVLIFGGIVLTVNVIAVSNYFMHKAYFDKMLLQSKAIPVLQMHHIHFGIINGLMLLMLGGLYLKKMLNAKQARMSVILFVGIFICFHILGSRTGLLSFYVASFVALLAFSMSTKKYKTVVVGSILIAGVLCGAYFLSTSFKNKISNSIEDYNSWSKGEEINFKSMAMRLEAYKASIGVFMKNPVLGVGAGNQENELQKMYDEQNSVLLQVNRVGPHNQILEYALKYGLFGVALVLGYFYYFLKGVGLNSFIFLAILAMLFTALQFESLWERQGSVFFTSIFIGLTYHLFRVRKNIIQE